MQGKTVVYVFIAVIIVIFAYYYTNLPQTPSSVINQIDQNKEYGDYQLFESTDIDSYIVIGQIEEITNDELKIRTFERVLTIKKPEATEYFAFPTVPIDETQLQQDDDVRVRINVDKTTNEVVKLSVAVIGQ